MNTRAASFFGFLVIGIAALRCSGDSKGGGGGSKPTGGTAGDAGEPSTGGSGGAGKGGTPATGGVAGKGGAAGKGGTTSTGGAAGKGGVSGDGGVPAGGAGDGGAPDTGGQGGASACEPNAARGSQVTLGQATATFSQTFISDFSVARTVDGITDDQLGWAIARDGSSTIGPETAALETATDTPVFRGGTRLTFVLTHAFTAQDHALGRFRISVTNADRAMFADGNSGTATPGNVGADAIWSPLTPTSACALGGVGVTTLGDASLLVDVNHLTPMSYVVVAETRLTGITGVRLEALEDASLPFGGPGLQALNGNFVLSEFEMYAEAP